MQAAKTLNRGLHKEYRLDGSNIGRSRFASFFLPGVLGLDSGISRNAEKSADAFSLGSTTTGFNFILLGYLKESRAVKNATQCAGHVVFCQRKSLGPADLQPG